MKEEETEDVEGVIKKQGDRKLKEKLKQKVHEVDKEKKLKKR